MRNKRILLINPPFYRLMQSHFNGLNLGVSYIASVLAEKDFNVKIYNADYVDTNNYPTQEQLFQNYIGYKEILSSRKSDIWREVKEKIKSFNPDIVGISMSTGSYKSSIIVAQLAREVNSEVLVVVGGPHPTLAPQTVRDEEVDYLIRGEGEFAFLEFVEGKPVEDIEGLSYVRNGEVIHNASREFIEDLDSLPFPARDLFLNTGDNMYLGDIMVGRGCPYVCSFCASPKIWKRSVRFRSPSSVIKEIKEVVGKYKQPQISFVDDTFTLVKERTKEICRLIINEGIEIQWKCTTRADKLDRELVSLMKRAGCICAKIGAESGSERILKLVQKHETKDDIRKAAKLIREQGIALTVYFMAGFPDETNEDLRETIEFAIELQADYYSLGIVAPYYGTGVYTMLKNQGKINEENHWEYFFHTSLERIESSGLDSDLVNDFLSIDRLYAKGARI